MRIIALLVVALLTQPAVADSSRAASIVEALELDEQTANKVLDILNRYDADLEKLERMRADLKRQFVGGHKKLPNEADRLLLDWSANRHSMAKIENDLIQRARSLLPGPKAVHLLMLVSITERVPLPLPEAQPAIATKAREPSVASGRHDPDALFPPGSPARPPCDPFASMHGCRY